MKYFSKLLLFTGENMPKDNKLNNYEINNNQDQNGSLSSIGEDNSKGNKLYILIGIPCSGKSTYAEMFSNSFNTVIISSDQIRYDLHKTNKFQGADNDLVFDIAEQKIEQALSRNCHVVFDATNTNKKYRKAFIDIGIMHNCHIVAVVFNTPVSTCLSRNSMRSFDRRVPEQLILQMSNFDSNIKITEGFNEVISISS